MKLDEWNRIRVIREQRARELQTVKRKAPEGAKELFVFAHYVVDWLPRGEWKLVCVDNSTTLSAVESHFVGRLLSEPDKANGIGKGSAFLLEFPQNDDAGDNSEMLLASLVFLLILFEAHAAITSSASSDGQILSIQDGFVYFQSYEARSNPEDLLKEYESRPRTLPRWVLDITAKRQS